MPPNYFRALSGVNVPFLHEGRHVALNYTLTTAQRNEKNAAGLLSATFWPVHDVYVPALHGGRRGAALNHALNLIHTCRQGFFVIACEKPQFMLQGVLSSKCPKA